METSAQLAMERCTCGGANAQDRRKPWQFREKVRCNHVHTPLGLGILQGVSYNRIV